MKGWKQLIGSPMVARREGPRGSPGAGRWVAHGITRGGWGAQEFFKSEPSKGRLVQDRGQFYNWNLPTIERLPKARRGGQFFKVLIYSKGRLEQARDSFRTKSNVRFLKIFLPI